MRQGIETAPKDGTIVILEDDASGTYDVAHWSAEATRWLGENGEPSKIAPTHWHQRPCDQYFPEEDERQALRFAAFPILAVGLLGMGLMSLYFFDSATVLPRQDSHKTDQRAEADRAREKKEGTRPQQAVKALPREARQSVMTVQSTESTLTNELAENRRAIDRLDRQFHAAVANAAQSIEQDQQRVTLARVDIAARQELSPSAEQDRQALEEERARSAALRSEVAITVRREVEAQAAQLRKFSDEAAQLKQAEAAKSAQSIEEERKRAADLALEVAAAQQELTASTEQHRQALEEERARSAALRSELTAVQREIETRTVQSQKAVDAATKQIQAAESTIAELRQSLQQEQNKTAALMEEAKAAQAMTTAAEPQRPALEEAQARAATLASELDASKKQKQAAEATAAELQKSLQQERDKTEAMARDLATVRRMMDGRVTVGRAADSHLAQVTQTLKTAATEPPKAVEAQGNAEATRLIARASALLGQGNIGAARIVLERAAESGNAQASFMLAETYDPVILSAWGTHGTRGEVAKAREFYAKARAGGIREAKERLDALRQ
jgi:chromosome segregation ATPase